MKKSLFNRLADYLRSRDSHISKRQRFHKLIPNPAGSKMAARCLPDSKRGADGTLRR